MSCNNPLQNAKQDLDAVLLFRQALNDRLSSTTDLRLWQVATRRSKNTQVLTNMTRYHNVLAFCVLVM